VSRKNGKKGNSERAEKVKMADNRPASKQGLDTQSFQNSKKNSLLETKRTIKGEPR